MRTSSRGPAGSVPSVLRSGTSVLNEAETVWIGMLDGWAAQQYARNLSAGTIEARRATVMRFRGFTDGYPWQWTAQMVDEFFLELRALKGAARSTVLGYQNALRMFLDYLTDPAYGWGQQCWDRFGEHPAQVFHEWNTARHAQDTVGTPGKRPYTRDELEDLFDCADERVLPPSRRGQRLDSGV